MDAAARRLGRDKDAEILEIGGLKRPRQAVVAVERQGRGHDPLDLTEAALDDLERLAALLRVVAAGMDRLQRGQHAGEWVAHLVRDGGREPAEVGRPLPIGQPPREALAFHDVGDHAVERRSQALRLRAGRRHVGPGDRRDVTRTCPVEGCGDPEHGPHRVPCGERGERAAEHADRKSESQHGRPQLLPALRDRRHVELRGEDRDDATFVLEGPLRPDGLAVRRHFPCGSAVAAQEGRQPAGLRADAGRRDPFTFRRPDHQAALADPLVEARRALQRLVQRPAITGPDRRQDGCRQAVEVDPPEPLGFEVHAVTREAERDLGRRRDEQEHRGSRQQRHAEGDR